jgi:hypothetical protein
MAEIENKGRSADTCGAVTDQLNRGHDDPEPAISKTPPLASSTSARSYE